MKYSIIIKQIVATIFLIIFIAPNIESQTRKIKRPKSKVGISSVDSFVQESFDLYDKVYKPVVHYDLKEKSCPYY